MLNITVQMMIRNEADIILECLSEIVRWGLSTVVILDGESTDGTPDLIRDYARRHAEVSIDLHSLPDPGGRFADHRRQELLALTRAHKPDWIISLDADEIYDSDPVNAIEAAQAAGAEYVRCRVPQFWLTYADIRAGLTLEDESVSVQQRRRWYSWGHTGVFLWKDMPDHHYPPDVQKRTPESSELVPRAYGPVYPICKHYPFRSLRQAVQRTQERIERGGITYFGKYYNDWLVDEQAAGLHHLESAWWDCEDNHDRLYQWWGSRGVRPEWEREKREMSAWK